MAVDAGRATDAAGAVNNAAVDAPCDDKRPQAECSSIDSIDSIAALPSLIAAVLTPFH